MSLESEVRESRRLVRLSEAVIQFDTQIEASIDPSSILVVDICFQICMLLEKHKVMQVYERCIIPVLYIELFDLHEGASLEG